MREGKNCGRQRGFNSSVSTGGEEGDMKIYTFSAVRNSMKCNVKRGKLLRQLYNPSRQTTVGSNKTQKL